MQSKRQGRCAVWIISCPLQIHCNPRVPLGANKLVSKGWMETDDRGLQKIYIIWYSFCILGNSVRNSPRQSANAEFFVEAYLCFLVFTVAMWLLGLIKKYFSKNKKKLVQKKGNFLIDKKNIFLFHMVLKLDCITQFTYFIIHICLYSLIILLLFSHISLQEARHRQNTNTSLLIQVAKNQQNEWKKA